MKPKQHHQNFCAATLTLGISLSATSVLWQRCRFRSGVCHSCFVNFRTNPESNICFLVQGIRNRQKRERSHVDKWWHIWNELFVDRDAKQTNHLGGRWNAIPFKKPKDEPMRRRDIEVVCAEIGGRRKTNEVVFECHYLSKDWLMWRVTRLL